MLSLLAARRKSTKLSQHGLPKSFDLKSIHMLLFLVVMLGAGGARAQQSEPTVPLSQRLSINLAAGVPQYVGNANSISTAPQSTWLYEDTQDSPNYALPAFVESSDPAATWKQIAVPYDTHSTTTFINQESGGPGNSPSHSWYRLHFKVDPKYAGQKFLLNLEGAHTAVQVFINGTLLPGISQVAANKLATHVVGFAPVVVDLTPYVTTDGTTDNVIAIGISENNSWFENPGFSGAFRFGQDMMGLYRNVVLYVTSPVHIPLNVYSNQKTWGTYVGTVSEVPSADPTVTATAASAVIDVQTNVVNESATPQQVTLTTQIVDAKGNVVVTAPPVTQTVAPMTAGSFPSTPAPIFDQQITIQNPTLWYPNNSTFGKPYLYKVYHIVSVNGVVVDSAQSPLGIRTITWDANFPSFNGHAMHLWGAGKRYDYPALGAAVPDEQVWRDMALLAAQGGNILRPGHSQSSEELVEAADAYGIMIDQPSGDGEGNWNASPNPPTADDLQLKQELHRDMIIRDRSHPSILDWEEDNGGMNQTLADQLATIETSWDNIHPPGSKGLRVQADRTFNPLYGFMAECDGAGCEVGMKQSNPNNPSFGAEYWDNMGTGRGTSTGTGANTVYAYDYELAFAAPYLDDWGQGKATNSFGMAQWYDAESPGEQSLWAEFQNQPNMAKLVRSLGYSSVDANRFPRLLYYIYAANWIPYSIQPVVHLAHHWNRAYEYTPGTPIQENAFSNCPFVRLLINGVAKDPVTGLPLQDLAPVAWTAATHGDLTQNTTVMPGQVHWMVNWAPGTATAVCLDNSGNPVPGVSHTVTTAGPENKIVLTAVPNLVKPDGTGFQWNANGSDAAFVVAQVQDASGNIVPTAADNATFTVTGPATYMGGTQQLVADPFWTDYFQDEYSQKHITDNTQPYMYFHSPGDPELNFEGGLQKIALRSTVTPGTVTVTASAPGLISGSVQLTSVQPPAPPQSQPQAPAIIVPPVNTAATAGFPATFTVAATGSGVLNYQWSVAGVQVPGATSPVFTIPATTIAQDGESVVVTITSTGGFGTVSSTPVTLSVSAPAKVVITTQPASLNAVVGQSATLSVAATGSPQLTYQWFDNSGPIPNGTQSSLTTPILTTVGTDNFYVIVSNPLGPVQSSTATLTVNAAVPVSVTSSPASQIVPANQPVQLTAVVAGSAPYSYQWVFTSPGGNPTILSSDTQLSNTISLTIPIMSAANVGSYAVIVNNAANAPTTSAAASLTLAPPGVNLALGKLATSSSSQNACADPTTAPPLSGINCLGAENAVDGNPSTRWGSAVADAPPTTVTDVNNSWLQVDLGSAQPFNTVIINWENAFAAQYQIQYTNQDPATNPTWLVAKDVPTGLGGTETINFPTVQARYVRVLGTLRSGNFGYSIFEFQVYNVAQCGQNERYTVTSDPTLVADNLLGLTWTRTIMTDNTPGSQFTGVSAAAFCSSQKMRIPTAAEALSIAGINNASCAFPHVWSTWTSTVDPTNSSQTAIVNFDGSSTFNVTNNFPGATLCAVGTSAAQPPVLQASPQPATVTVGQAAMFTVAATGTPSPSYQWLENGAPISGATSAAYITPLTAMTDNGEVFSVVVSNGSGTFTTPSALLTVSATPVGGGGTGGGGTGGGTGGGGTGNNPPPPPTPTCGNAIACTGNGNGPAPVGPNLALHKTALSSADESGSFPAANGVDGSGSTRWSSGFEPTESFQVDLGSVQPIGQVLIRWQDAYATDYLIQTSNDAQTWTQAIEQPNGLGGVDNLTFPTVNARYIRMLGKTRALPQYGYSFWEFEVYGPVGPTIVTEPVNETVVAGTMAQFTVVATANAALSYQWLLNGVAIPNATNATYTTPMLATADTGGQYSVVVTSGGIQATSTVATVTVTNPSPGVTNLALNKLTTSSGNENAGVGPMNAVDGDPTTRWSSAFADPSWIEVDLGSPMLINEVKLYWEAAYGSVYNIEVSNDEQTWTPVYKQTAGTGGVETLKFPATINRFIRMYGKTRATGYGYSLFEFQVFGADVPMITSQPASQTLTAGSTATFNVVAGGDGPFTYQWLRNGVVLNGATGTSYTTQNLLSGDSGSSFSVNVTNASGTTTSTQALVTVNSSTPTGPNLALNQPAAESAGENDANLGPAFAVDGNLTTRWSSAAGKIEWISVDLGKAQTINQVILNWEAAYGVAYQIQVSNDAQTWNPVFSQNAGQGGVENITFAPVSARFVRMYGTQRATQYGYSLYEFGIYGPATATGPSIVTEPVNQSATVGSKATFTVTAGGPGPFTYQWLKNGTPISGATSASYITPPLTITDSGTAYSVTVGAGGSTVTSTIANLTVSNYTIYPGFIGVDLNNNTNGAWADNQVYVTVIGMDVSNSNFAYLTPTGNVVDFTMNDATAANHLTQNGQNFGNYSFTLAQSKLLKIPLFKSARVYFSLGAPLYVQVNGDANGNVTGYAGPNPQNGSDPNINTHFDWMEFDYEQGGGPTPIPQIFINTTQVDEFGLPLLLDVWASGATFHKQVGITESIAQLDTEFAAEVPAQFQPTTMSNLRIFSPAKLSMAAGGANGNYFDNLIAKAWSTYATTPISITLNGRQFTGSAAGSTLTFNEVNPAAGNVGESFVVQQPSTQDVLGCAGTMATGVPNNGDENNVQLQLENQICSAINRGVLPTPANWANASAYYGTAPANYYSRFWHNHSIGGLAYGFSYDDNNNQSTTIATQAPEHMSFGIGW